MADRCKSCKAPVRWALTENGRWMILDREPTDAGEWRLVPFRRGQAPRCLHVPEERRAELAGELLTAHWATCPNADEHRKAARA